MKTKNQSSLPSKYWLIIVIVICVILMGVERITGGNGPISFIANYTVIPMQKGIGYVGRYMSDLSDNFETLQDMKKENKKLQSKVDDLTITPDSVRISINWKDSVNYINSMKIIRIIKKSAHM